MAIQIRSIGANRDAVSISLSASVSESPAKLTIVTLSGDTISSASSAASISSTAGIAFNGQLVSYSNRYEQGKYLSTKEYIDNSINLDQKCIVLFRRGLGGSARIVTKTVRVPFASVSYRNGSVTFSFGSKDINLSVQRLGGNSAAGLGFEEWSSNPCDSSNVTYPASQALSIIGAPGVFGASTMQCSYEGTYRSVLSSIYSDLGVGYWWDWRGGGIRVIDGSIGFSVPTQGCGILSAENGATRMGVVSQSSWAFSRWPGLKTSQGTGTITTNNYFEVSPEKHPNYPTDDEILEQACPALRTYNSLINRNFRDLGYDVLAKLDISTSTLPPLFQKWLKDKFNFSESKTLKQSLYEFLNIEGNGQFYLAMPLKSNTTADEKEFVLEMFYKYDDNNNNNYSSGNEFKFQRLETSYNPEISQRGKNKYGNTYEDENNIVRKGHWRSVQYFIGGDTDATDFNLAVEDCIKQVSHDVICDIFDSKDLPSFSETVEEKPISINSINSNSFGTVSEYLSPGQKLRNQIENQGKVIIFVKSPRFNISVARGGTKENPNDIRETYDYEDPNNIPESPPSPEKPELEDPCEDIIPNLSNPNLNLELNDGIIDGPKLTPGLENAFGQSYEISCNGKKIEIILPSESRLKVVRTIRAEYFAATRSGVKDATNTWFKAGGISSNYGLSHSVAITDITPDENEVISSYTIPSALGGAGVKWLKTAQAECDGFFLPIIPGLESLSATLDSRGLRVSYSYKEIPAKPKPIRGLNSIARSNTSITFS